MKIYNIWYKQKAVRIEAEWYSIDNSRFQILRLYKDKTNQYPVATFRKWDWVETKE